MNNPYAWLFLSVLSIFSVIFGVWSWFAGKHRKEISVQCKSDILIKAGKKHINKLDVQYDGKSIDELSSSKFYIWNSGNQMLQNADIVQARPITISSNTATILDAQIVRVSEETNAFVINIISDKQVNVDFEYIEAGNGVLVQILHTGDSLDLVFDCKIKGGNEIRDCTKARKNRRISIRDKFLDFVATDFATFVMLAFLCIGVVLAPLLLNIEKDGTLTFEQFLGYIVILLLSGAIGLIASKCLSSFANRLFNRSIPQSLLTSIKKEQKNA